MRPKYLVLCQFSAHLMAAVIERSMGKSSVLAMFREEFNESVSLELCLKRLKNRCQNYASLWERAIHVCLPSHDAVFKNFVLPPARKKQAKKSVLLMLDGECPFDLTDHATKIYLSQAPNSKSLNALVTIVANKLLATWDKALKAVRVPEAHIEIQPWPCIRSLPVRKKNTLLLILEESAASMSAISVDGKPLWIRQLITFENKDSKKLAEQIIHQYELAAGTKWQAEELLVLPLNPLHGIKEALSTASGLPVHILGEKVPLGGGYNRIAEHEPERLLAMAEMPSRMPWQKFPVFILHPYIATTAADCRKLAIPAGAIGLLLCLIFFSIALDARARFEAAENLREKLATQLRKTLGDAPKNASSGRLQSILNSRIRSLQEDPSRRPMDTMLGRLKEIHQLVSPELKVDVRRLHFADGHIRLYGQSADYAEVNRFKEALDQVPGLANCRIVNASSRSDIHNARNNAVDFEMDLSLASPKE